jgi:nucleoid DNA-binding protein
MTKQRFNHRYCRVQPETTGKTNYLAYSATKSCSRCGVEKPLTAFAKCRSQGGHRGRQVWCRGCFQDYGRERAATERPALTRKDLARAVVEAAGVPVATARIVVGDVVGLIAHSLLAGRPVRLRGLGVFEIKDRPPRPARNPKTGERIELPPGKKIRFKAAKSLIEDLNEPLPQFLPTHSKPPSPQSSSPF